MNKFMEDYADSIKDVEKNSKTLKNNCVVKFADLKANSSCTNFKANYEAAMNYYITDIKNYDKTVEQFNKWAEENNKEGRLKEGTYPVYKKYIDFDEDGEYFGKGEDKNE